MKALVFEGQLRLDHDRPEPQVRAGEALVKVRLAGICATDLEITKGYMDFTGVLGHEFVGEVVRGSDRWVGRRVVGEINCVCRSCDMCSRGLANHCRKRTVLGIAGRDGAFAELLALPEANLHAVPDVITDERAVFVEPLAAAYQVLKQCPIEKHQRVAVLGSGRLGLLVAQVIQKTGCKLEVIGRNPHTLSFCEKRGIQTVSIDDVAPRGEHDVVVDCTGNPQAFGLATELVRPRGTIVLKSTHAANEPLNLAPLVINEVTLLGSRCGPFVDALAALARAEIHVDTMVSRTYDLADAVDAVAAAADPGNIKILLRTRPT
ncbi:MAG: alcohol dehydrogenase catalytic domain-containing protein [Planctomycetes bacterium]|nr:alcohol dehydrogenase catalytic domain-containing protein [Planctomycetota bacterium]